MSRIAKNPVFIPDNVEVVLADTDITVKGPLGVLSRPLGVDVLLKREGSTMTFVARDETAQARAMSGTIRALVSNMVHGVSKGFVRKLTLVGVGYKASAQATVLNLELGYSHPIVHKMPVGIKVETPSLTEVVLTGIDKQLVGEVAAHVRAYRPPEPYKGKGVRYADEVVIIKETKKK
ncbi:MAG: 50S ribosomal protein L6 [Methylophilaceae bacterium]|nr:50S ribosomal protein L6 [Methylophilaceae bacterium]